MFTAINHDHIQFFIQALGGDAVKTNESDRVNYGHDHTEDLSFPPEVVLLPHSTKEVSLIMAYCYEQAISVTPIGARTGLSGGALSVYGGVGLCLERMNKIIKIDEDNQQVITQPGVITQVLQEAVAEKDLFYAPDPASRGTCFIGGNLAENSGGPRAVKYGVTKDFVLNLEVVLANGEIIHTGANTLKNSTGYNLTQLMVGSEGTLGVITAATLKLLPLPKKNMLMLVSFKSAEDACEAVSSIFKAGLTPSALEFMERDAVLLAQKFTGEVPFPLAEDCAAQLLIEMDGNDEDRIMTDCEAVMVALESFETDEIYFADSEAQKEKLWFLRRRVGEAVKACSVYKEEDTVVPRFELPRLLSGVKQIGKEYGFKSVCYGHAGDGNLHVNILKGDLSEALWKDDLPKAISEIFELCVQLGGTISGEHGIGFVQKEFMPIAFSKVQLNLMKSIKKTFDPKGILNPGKLFPE